MKDGDHHDSIVICMVEERVRKPMKQDPPECALNDLER
jgi:hypothetical protein